MATRSSFEKKNRERRRRERLRRKRMRSTFLVIVIAAIIALIIVGIFNVIKNNQNTSNDIATLPTATPDPGTLTTITASIDGTVTGTSEFGTTPQAAPETPAGLNVSSIPSASEENDLIEIIADSGQKKRCYLTFDDGPTNNITPQILDTLRKYNVKATFFQVGSLIKANPNMTRRVYEEGHLIANHSYKHEYDELYESSQSFMNEIEECYEAIKSLTDGEEPFKLVRFPGGGFESSADSYSTVKQECKTKLKEAGYYYCDWNSLNGDAQGKTKNAQELLEYLQSSTEGLNNLIILMHDASAKQATADYLADAIEWLISEGYTFHRLDDIEYNTMVSESPSPTSTPTVQ